MGGERVVSVYQATSAADLDHARAFFRSFVAWHRDRHTEDLDLIDGYFDPAGLDRGLVGSAGRAVLSWARVGRGCGCQAGPAR